MAPKEASASAVVQQMHKGKPAAVVMGVLALQGAFREHVEIFTKMGVPCVEVRLPEDLEQVTALVLPGGESTTIALLARRWGLMDPLREWVASGKPIWGTCAGMIMLANRLTGKMKEGQETIGGFNATVHRNYFGSQLGSFHAELESVIGSNDQAARYTACFIRAPVIVEWGDNVKVLATVRSDRHSKEAADRVDSSEATVAARQGSILVTSFHPELTTDPMWHSYFFKMAEEYMTSE